MPDTTNYGWTYPTVGGNADTWGTVINTAFQAIDTSLKAVEDQQNGFLTIANNLSDLDNAATARTNLGLVIGTNVQAYSAGLQSLAGLTTVADRMVYTTASDTYATTTLTSFARTLLDDTSAAAARTTLGLGTAATQATGTSGATIPLLNGDNTHSGTNNFTGTTSVDGKRAMRVDIGTSTNSGLVTVSTSAPGTLDEGAIHLQIAS